MIADIFFNHRNIHKYTWYSNNHIYKLAIDHILVQKLDQKLVKDVRVFRGAELGVTDHHLVIAK